ncbi:MAG: hypothetical protein BWK73_12290 [Thiothrix lacustris]|uniref:Endonuclease GajA/Old nuclease/RecF-like AAA domain-containing protein n=1 Tax=Thiothrix lacustris TaxID=525917 RepID=A0A1Y1QTB3_9GAMM|nr:MAG: hypothetical protein BWK73_12290 [Thiothrix lacustris]
MLDSLHIKNFRCFEDLTIPSLGQVNLIVGKNNSGKSSFLDAIRVFASKGSMNTLNDILISRDELVRSGEDEEQDFLLSLTSLFYGRELPEEQDKGIMIGSITNVKQRLKIDAIAYVEQFEVTEEEASGRTIRRRKRIPIDEFQSLFPTLFPIDETSMEDVKIGIYVSYGDSRILIDSYYYRRPLLRKDAEKLETSHSYVPTKIVSPSEIASLWDQVLFTPYEEEIKKSLALIEENILDIGFIKSSKNSRDDRMAIVKIRNSQKPIPLKSMGEGISRLLQLFLYAFQAKSGFLLIDEFENGLHYSIQEEVWEKLFKLAKELDIQVFATTHSEDTIKAFCKVSLADDEVDGKLISLGRSAAIADNGKILADVYDEKTLAWIVQSGMEIR